MSADRKYRTNSQTATMKEFLRCEGVEVVFYDLETTGLDLREDKIIEFSGIRCVIKNASFEILEEKTVYINPEIPLPGKIVEITGYHDDFFVDKPVEKDAFPEIYSFLKGKKIVAGYNNNAFDNAFLTALYQRYNVPISFSFDLESFAEAKKTMKNHKLSLDVFWLVKEYVAGVENHKLMTVASHFGLDKGIDFHKASSDVLATVRIANVLIPDVQNSDGRFTGTLRPKIVSVSFYEGFKGCNRVYVNTTAGTVFYELRDDSWQGKDVDVFTLDMPHIVGSLLNYFGITTEKELRKSTMGKGIIYVG